MKTFKMKNPFAGTNPEIYLQVAEGMFNRGPNNPVGICIILSRTAENVYNHSREETAFTRTFRPSNTRWAFWMRYGNDGVRLSNKHLFERRLLALLLCYEMSKDAGKAKP